MILVCEWCFRCFMSLSKRLFFSKDEILAIPEICQNQKKLMTFWISIIWIHLLGHFGTPLLAQTGEAQIPAGHHQALPNGHALHRPHVSHRGGRGDHHSHHDSHDTRCLALQSTHRCVCDRDEGKVHPGKMEKKTSNNIMINVFLGGCVSNLGFVLLWIF